METVLLNNLEDPIVDYVVSVLTTFSIFKNCIVIYPEQRIRIGLHSMVVTEVRVPLWLETLLKCLRSDNAFWRFLRDLPEVDHELLNGMHRFGGVTSVFDYLEKEGRRLFPAFPAKL